MTVLLVASLFPGCTSWQTLKKDDPSWLNATKLEGKQVRVLALKETIVAAPYKYQKFEYVVSQTFRLTEIEYPFVTGKEYGALTPTRIDLRTIQKMEYLSISPKRTVILMVPVTLMIIGIAEILINGVGCCGNDFRPW